MIDQQKLKSNIQKMLLFCSKIGSEGIQVAPHISIPNCNEYLDFVKQKFDEIEKDCLKENKSITESKAYIMHYRNLLSVYKAIGNKQFGKVEKIEKSFYNQKKYKIIVDN